MNLKDEGEDGAGLIGVPFAAVVLFEAALAPLALALGYAMGFSPLAGVVWDAGALPDGLLAAGPMVLFLVASLRWPVGPLKGVRAFFDREIVPTMAGRGWPDLALLSAAAGVGEEMLFRGVIQASLVGVLGPVGGVAASSALFGLVHPVSATYVAIATLLGAYLGVVWLVTGNLLVVIVAHAVYDFIALVLLLRGPAEPDA